MSLGRRCTRLVLITGSLALAVACGRSEPPAESPAPAVDRGAHMGDHFDKIRDMEVALVRGDLESAAELGRWIAEHETIAGFDASLAPHVDAMKRAGAAVGSATTPESAAVAAARAVAACGTCHAAGQVTVAMPALVPPTAEDGSNIHMLEHQYAIDLMLQGLVGPSDEAWVKGAQAMKSSPLSGHDAPEVSDAVKKFEARVHELAERAATATTVEARVAIYGELIGSCASCHGEHGRVLGPGVPQAN